MKNLKEILDLNPENAFVVYTKSKEEFEQFRDTVLSEGFDFVIIPEGCEDSFEAMNRHAEDCDYKGCWRVCRYRGIAFNPSIEHWKDCGYTVLGVNQNGKLEII